MVPGMESDAQARAARGGAARALARRPVSGSASRPDLRPRRGSRRGGAGAILEELSSQGWNAIHDVSLGRGNVDHIVVGPGGSGLEVEPLLVFTQAWLVGSVPTRQRGVVILPGRLRPRRLRLRDDGCSRVGAQIAYAERDRASCYAFSA